MSQKTLAILAVDDEKIILESLKIQLERNFNDRFIIDFAENADEALEVIDELMLENISILLVISDYMMPGMNGEELAKTLKAGMPNINILLLTGHISEDKGIDLINKNIVLKVMQKPWNEEALISFINNLTGSVQA